MHKYRTHNCSELRTSDENTIVKLSGWVHRIRDHGNLLFIDLRDHYGITQCVIENTNVNFKILEKIKPDSVVSITGKVLKRTSETINKDLPTGKIELEFKELEILSEAKELPVPVFGEQNYPEDMRLKYRFLDLRRETMHNNIILRSKVIAFIRKKMTELGFNEFQTPILTVSSPEGARDFLVPSRLNPGKFYALPQAPQQFKQMIMVAGFDKYFQIAPCFRDEDGRADRSPGEHYQLDMEMSFVEKEDIFSTIEPLFYELFSKFGGEKKVSDYPFKKISYNDSMLQYGTDKPDLRNPLIISDVTDIFNSPEIKLDIFKKQISKGAIVRAVPAPNTVNKPRSFYDHFNEWAKTEGANGLAYLSIIKTKNKLTGTGPIAKFFSDNGVNKIVKACNLKDGDSVFFSCEKKQIAEKISFDDSMLQYGTDKPDLRNPLKISDVTDIFNSVDIKLNIFKKQINKGAIVRAIPAPNTFKKPRSFYDSTNEWAKMEGANGLAYLSIIKIKDKLAGSGPIAKFFSDNGINKIAKACNLKEGDAVFFSCEKKTNC